MSKPVIYVLGAGLPRKKNGTLLPFEHPALALADVIVGGRQELELVFGGTAQHAEMLKIGKDIPALIARMKENLRQGKTQVVLAGGDPLFHGIGSTLLSHFDREELCFSPGISSPQAAASLLGLNQANMRILSLHGKKDFTALDGGALAGSALVCILADGGDCPSRLAAFLLERGLGHFRMRIVNEMHIDAADGLVKAEKIISTDPAKAAASGEDCAQPPPCRQIIILEPCQGGPDPAFGNTADDYAAENSLFTKWPVRAAALYALNIAPGHTVWDIGAGSGAVGLEAARLAHSGRVFAFEQSETRARHILENRQNAGIANLEVRIGTAPGCLDPSLPRPDRIFIGGGLGSGDVQGSALLKAAWGSLLPEGRMVIAAILFSSLELAREILEPLGAGLEIIQLRADQASKLGESLYFKARNPVFLIAATKPGASSGCRQ